MSARLARSFRLAAWSSLLVHSAGAGAHPCKLQPVVFVAQSADAAWPSTPAAAKLLTEGGFRKSNDAPAGRRERHGIGEILVTGEPAAVLASVQRYGDYHELAPKKFTTSRLVALSKTGQSDVYMQIAVLRGALTLWLTMRFDPPRIDASGARVVEGRYLDGNLEGAHVRYVVASAGEHRTYVRLELWIGLPVPAPQGAIDEELRDAAGDALRGIAARFPAPAP